jgi:Cell wall-active antibiotics response 4TMS YvqF/Domain of unknown function (DUF5668)
VNLNYRPNRGLMGGLLILGLGVLLLADQAGYVSASHVLRIFWPVVFMAFGLEDLLLGFSPTKRVWGALIFVAGALFLVGNLGYVHIHIALLWPLILIAVGVAILAGKLGHGPTFFPFPHQGRPHPPHPWIRSGPGRFGGPFGMGGPTGPTGPGNPSGPAGFAGPSGPAPQGPSAGQPQAGTAAPFQGTQEGPGTTTPPPQNPNPAGPAYPGAGPQDYSDWKSQRREFKRQMRSLKRGWHDNNWQRHSWSGQENFQQSDPQQNGPQTGPQQNYAQGNDSNESQFNYSVIFSHVERRITSKNFKSGSLSAILGGFEIDLSRADIEGDEAVIYADAFFGGGEIRIPETWLVVVEGNALFGAFMDETRQRPPEGSAPQKKLIIRGTAVFGGVSIEN